jgi:hypothetical protein
MVSPRVARRTGAARGLGTTFFVDAALCAPNAVALWVGEAVGGFCLAMSVSSSLFH